LWVWRFGQANQEKSDENHLHRRRMCGAGYPFGFLTTAAGTAEDSAGMPR
jgi:hypothetical protein